MSPRTRKSQARQCRICRRPLRRADKFCSQCGAPVGEVVGSPIPPPLPEQWEYCEIIWSARGFLTNDRSFFWAQNLISGAEIMRGATAFAPLDVTITLPRDDANTRAAVKELVQQLLDDGWEPIKTNGTSWWNQRFGRQIRS